MVRSSVIAPPAVALASLVAACGGGGPGDRPDGGAEQPDARSLPDAACSPPGSCAPGSLVLTLFVFDQTNRTLWRMEDVSGDGDLLDVGEITRFFDDEQPLGIYNSMGMIAVSGTELLATDNVAGANNVDSNVVRLRDLNGDGDALDAGEASPFWTGALPGGGALSFPVALTRGPDDDVFLVQNDAFDDAIDAIYRLHDGDADGDVDDEGEVTLFRDLTVAEPGVTPQFLDFEFGADGVGYGMDLRNLVDANDPSLDRMAPGGGALTELLDASDLYVLSQAQELIMPPAAANVVEYDAATDEVLQGTIDRYEGQAKHLIAVKDRDGSGAIDRPDELRVVFDEEEAVGLPEDFNSFAEFIWIPDGSVVAGDPLRKRLLRLVDEDQDGDFNDAGEVRTIYDGAVAALAGLPEVLGYLTMVAHGRAADPE